MSSFQWLPAAPLFDTLRECGIATIDDICERTGVGRATIHEARTTGRITDWTADKVAIRALNIHPQNIYGHKWLTPDDRIDVAFHKLHEAAS